MARFNPYGPFPIVKRNGSIDLDDKNEFWEQVEHRHAGLPHAIGCYIFGIRAGKGILPWYVGKTQKRSFKFETWQPHKLLLMNKVLNQQKGAPVLYLIAQHTPKTDAFTKPGKLHTSISTLEELLIAVCLLRNSNLLNKKLTKFVKETVVPGYLNGGNDNKKAEAKALAALLTGKTKKSKK